MHKSGEQHTLTALSPKMSSFFISSVTWMSWRQRHEGHVGGERQPGGAGVGTVGAQLGRGGYRHAFRLTVRLQGALAIHEGDVVEVDGG